MNNLDIINELESFESMLTSKATLSDESDWWEIEFQFNLEFIEILHEAIAKLKIKA